MTGIAVFMNARTANATIDVESVSAVSTMYWGDQSSTYGTATSDFVQELYPDTTKSISEIFVEEGQTVKIGDTLLQYDTTKLELTVESKKLEVEKKNYELQQANKDLVRLQNTPPYVEPPIPEPEPEPTPTPVPPSAATLYSEITEHSKPFKGTGTTEDPYVFLCTEDCVLSKEFLMRLMGLSTLAEPLAVGIPDAAAERNADRGAAADGITDRDGFPVADRIAGADTLPHPGGNADARSRADWSADCTAGIRRREHTGRLRHGLVPAADNGRRDCGRQRADR